MCADMLFFTCCTWSWTELEKLRESKAEELKQCLKDQEEQLSRDWQKKFEIEINQAVSNAVATCEASNIEKNKKQTEAATQVGLLKN